MHTQIGDQTHPSVAWLDSYICCLDSELNLKYSASTTGLENHQTALAGFTNLLFCLGWLRSSKVFKLMWQDLQVMEPKDVSVMDLPLCCAWFQAIWSHCPDVPMAYKSMLALHLGKWFHSAQQACGLGANFCDSSTLMFCQPIGNPRMSKYFCHFLYPLLHHQRAAGKPYICPFNGSPSNSIEAKFWSLHCYHCGAFSHVSHKQIIRTG